MGIEYGSGGPGRIGRVVFPIPERLRAARLSAVMSSTGVAQLANRPVHAMQQLPMLGVNPDEQVRTVDVLRRSAEAAGRINPRQPWHTNYAWAFRPGR